MIFLGVDVGSVSVKSVLISEDGTILNHQYIRHHGQPLQIAKKLLESELSKNKEIAGIGFTGSGGRRIADALGMPFENEIICHSRSASKLTPEAKCMILVGGEDSYFVLMNEKESDESVGIKDFAMNGICAAGCGSFLDQQASRLGIDIEGEFGKLAVESTRPSRVAGRCSVFAKTDMIHLQQKATPVQDIVAGLCFAFARNYVAVLARGKDFTPPIVFHGGVSKNDGMVRAFKEILELEDNQLIIHEYSAVAGAYGSALLAKNTYNPEKKINLEGLDHIKNLSSESDNPLPPLPQPSPAPGSRVYDVETDKVEAYLGVDIGSISTNVVVMDSQRRVLHKSYLMTAGRPIEAVRKGLAEASEKLADKVEIRGVCTTGSGRYLIGDFLGADVVKNEITAQARAAVEIDPNVDTIFEIGGQDSKYISLENGAIIDFEMNKVCAAGTGSFLEEQAEKLGVSIKGEFAQLALEAQNPVRLGERCTVFMESDLVGHQGRGASTPDLAAGLAYSTVYNYHI
ncbi:MAG: acyl-CoA dehydratase activase [Armatimonadota bacterium]